MPVKLLPSGGLLSIFRSLPRTSAAVLTCYAECAHNDVQDKRLITPNVG